MRPTYSDEPGPPEIRGHYLADGTSASGPRGWHAIRAALDAVVHEPWLPAPLDPKRSHGVSPPRPNATAPLPARHVLGPRHRMARPESPAGQPVRPLRRATDNAHADLLPHLSEGREIQKLSVSRRSSTDLVGAT